MEDNEMELRFKAISINESFARTSVAAFCLMLNPSVEEINDIKTAVSEAVTNCIVHAYPKKIGDVIINLKIENNIVIIKICDNGIGIEDYEKARQPFYTTKPDEERSGMGFAVMESFMDSLDLSKNGDSGLCVTMTKKIKNKMHLVG
jgi:stage II sporulation protein AB (anti-sigma F factor)